MLGSLFDTASAAFAATSLLALQANALSPVSLRHSRKLTSTAAPLNSEGKYEYLGCFKDSKEDRVLGRQDISSVMTTEVCYQHCFDRGATFMATQFGSECWCEDTVELKYERHGDNAICDYPCTGDESETCGGFDAFSLYSMDSMVPAECTKDLVEPYEECESSMDCCTEGHECVGLGANECYWQCRPFTSTSFTTMSDDPPSPMTAATLAPYAAPVADPVPAPVVEATPSPVTAATPAPIAPPPVADPTPAPVVKATPSPITAVTPAPVAPPVEAPTPVSECKVVIIEAESLTLKGAWSKKADDAASGGEYIVWEGLGSEQNNRAPEETDTIVATIQIPAAGTYSFKWAMRQPSGVASDKGNDSWLYFPDADRFGPADSSHNYGEFVKVYGNAPDGTFEYQGTAEEENGDKTQMAIEFGMAGGYTMEIAGRSHGHEIDQIIMFDHDLHLNDALAGC
ncbi:unnamed protein product [Pylaiella littoralis]